MKKSILLLSILLVVTFSTFAINQAKEPNLSTRLIITVDTPIREKGGAVIVSGRPIADNEWRLLPSSVPNKSEHEKEFHVRVSSPASIVEFVYPDSGTYSFKLESVSQNSATPLQSREIQVGSAEVTDPETRQQVDWPSMSVIHIQGSHYDEGWARILTSTFATAFRFASPEQILVNQFPGGRVIALSDAAIDAYVRDTK